MTFLSRLIFASLGLLLLGGAAARADLVLSNIGDFDNGDYGVGQTAPYATGRAQSFHTGADSMLFDYVHLAIDSGSGAGGFQVSLFSDDSGLPGASLLTLSGPDSPTAAGIYSYNAPTPFTLQPDSVYWIVAEPPLTGPTTNYNCTFTVSSVATSTNGWYFGGDALSFSFMGWAPQWSTSTMTLRMELGATIPEPGAGLLLLSAVGAVAAGGRFRRGWGAAGIRRLGSSGC